MSMTLEEFLEQHSALDQFLAEINECRVGYQQGHREALLRMAGSARNLASTAEALANSGWMNRP